VEGETANLARLIDTHDIPDQNHESDPRSPPIARLWRGASLENSFAGSADIRDVFRSACCRARQCRVDATYAGGRDRYLPELRRTYRTTFESGVAAIVFPATLTPPR